MFLLQTSDEQFCRMMRIFPKIVVKKLIDHKNPPSLCLCFKLLYIKIVCMESPVSSEEALIIVLWRNVAFYNLKQKILDLP